jgi:class 3 adenylate cyclase/predicted ATPase
VRVESIEAAIMDVAAWLRSLGLERYEATFRDNEIDDAVLSSLTSEDLKDLGIGIVGHRRKLLNAIAALRAAAVGPAALDVAARDYAERRHVTVMFSDLVGSTALSARMDPEDLREVMTAYQRCVAETVHRFGGFVARYMGDGALIYFGYPQAHEDDAERAIVAGLELVSAVTALAATVVLQTRIGIATGLVVVGDLIGSGDAQERGIVGETPNLAARLQALARPNTVVIAEGTRKLLGDLFEFEDLGAQELKGIGQVHAYEVLRASAIASRFEALHATGLTALVGREEECELLFRRWVRTKSGEGQIVLLSGEAGIGKSRLTAALLDRLAAEPRIGLRYFCSPQHTDSALYPVIDQMERAAGFTHDDAPQEKLDKLDALLARTSTPVEHAALFADLLSLPCDERYPALELSPQHHRQRTLDAMVAQLEALASPGPVMMTFEDAHWVDPTSLELLGLMVNRIASLPVLLIVTFRPDFEPPWIGRPHVTTLTLNRLARREVATLIDRVAGDRLLPAGIRQDIIDRTDGIPLFVEEMTRAVIEAETEGEARRTAAAIPAPGLTVPATLHASLMARLDRLGPAKETAQIGAAIGREFSHALLAAVVDRPDAELSMALDRIVQSGLLFRQGVPPHATYLFKHALVRDAAYGTLLREPRRVLHARIAAALESRFADIAESQPELLARHCTEAGLAEKAADLWDKAGQRSLARSALVEATAQLTRALAQIAGLPPTAARRRQQIVAQVGLANALMHTKGYAAPETKASLDAASSLIERAQSLGEQPEDPLLLFSVLYGFWVANYVAFSGDVVRGLASQFLALAKKQSTPAPLMIAHRLMATSLLFTGDVAPGRAHYDQAIALYHASEHRPLATRFGQDVRVATLSLRSLASWVLGFPDAALKDAAQALNDARLIDSAATLMYALFVTSWPQLYVGNYAAAGALIDELVALADEKAASLWKAGAMLQRGWLLGLTGKPSDAVHMLMSGIDAAKSTSARVWMPSYWSYLASAHAQLGRFDEARHCSNEAITAMKSTGERWCESDIHRIAGEIALLAQPAHLAEAEAHFDRALAVARTQQARSWELRATISLARLRRDQGREIEARSLLSRVYGWFTEGLGTLDLTQAKALLDRL